MPDKKTPSTDKKVTKEEPKKVVVPETVEETPKEITKEAVELEETIKQDLEHVEEKNEEDQKPDIVKEAEKEDTPKLQEFHEATLSEREKETEFPRPDTSKQ